MRERKREREREEADLHAFADTSAPVPFDLFGTQKSKNRGRIW